MLLTPWRIYFSLLERYWQVKPIVIIALVAIAYLVLTGHVNISGYTFPHIGSTVPNLSGFTSLQSEAYNDAVSEGINPRYFVNQIQQESGFNPGAYNATSQASGIAQFIPSTARSWGVDPWDPHSSLKGAARYMRYYQDLYGSYRAALIAYNCGPGCVGRPLLAETINYINVIMN